jgi:arylsulfatase A-like enzyme
MDLTASILAATDTKVPESYRTEGINLLQLLAERKTVERTLFWRIHSSAREQKAVRRGRWKYLQEGQLASLDSAEFIFDVEQDPGERRNLVIERSALLPGFRKLVAEWEADIDRQ